jgi:hypothetical protein
MKAFAILAALCLALSAMLSASPALADVQKKHHAQKKPAASSTPADHSSLNCPAPNAVPIMPDSVHGVVTRIQINPKVGNSIALTVQPTLDDLDLVSWTRRQEEAGVNIAEMQLQPADKLPAAPTIAAGDWQAYIDAALIPSSQRSAAQQDAYKSVRSQITAKNGVKNVTADQEEQVLLALLSRLEALKTSGKICGNIQFIVIERRWFPTTGGRPNGRALDKRLDSETVYAQTMASFVNKANAAGLGHWLAGILFAEHTNTDMSQMLPITVDLADRINELTQGWLRSHLMIGAGGGFGNQFNGIDSAVCPADAGRGNSSYRFACEPGQPFDFFPLIAKQTGSFAFGYKMFNWKTAPTPRSYCEAYRKGCDPKAMTVADWTEYLSDGRQGLGFGDLAAFVNKNAAAYPRAANVIFIGNGADSIFRMVKVDSDSTGSHLIPLPQLTALTGLFQKAAQKGGGWSGRIFMDAYGDQDRVLGEAGAVDNGGYLFFVDHSPSDFTGSGKVSANLESQAFWRAWPRLPAEPRTAR